MRNRLMGLAAAATLVALSGAACLDEGEVLTGPAGAEEEAQETQMQCEAILGKAFASADERQWFIDNCSRWEAPQPQAAPAQQPPQAPVSREPEECAQIRGRQYESQQQRAWFLQNCTGARAGGAIQPSQGSDRTNCDEIRGTQYRSAAERNWYLTHCMYSPGPDRSNCDEIRGTQYRSNAEREWFLGNCLTVGQSIQQGGGNAGINIIRRGREDDDDRGRDDD
jgi:hypothetical protein